MQYMDSQGLEYYFNYGDKETDYLRQKDKRLAELIDRVGHIHRAVNEDLFSSVVHHIIGQQISTKAQQTVWRRMQERFGEGWLMAAEIEHYAREGVDRFVILQPFGCLPNHISGRGVVKRLKAAHPGISILPLDLDPDTSYANVENRLQMLIMADSK